MKRGYPPLWLALLLLTLALCWRMLGAPTSAAQWGELETPLWQARVLAPSRVGRLLRLWLPGQPSPGQPSSGQPSSSQPSGSPGGDALNPVDEEAAELARLTGNEPSMVKVYLSPESGVTAMPLESYVCGVVAAEMPAAYHEEALKAQAVAARTRAVCQRQSGGCPRHPGADVCGDSGCCQGYAGTAACMAKWGEEYELYRQRVIHAAQATADELLLYEDQPITVLYHAISGGVTESAQAAFAQALPYLVSVESGGEEDARGFLTDSFFTFEEAAALLNRQFADLCLTAEAVRQTLTVGEHTASGRAATVLAGGRALDAQAVRQALKLRSTWFSITMDKEGVTFHQRGYGHGVGMSQVGANRMAADGADYRAILAHYYPGVTLSVME